MGISVPIQTFPGTFLFLWINYLSSWIKLILPFDPGSHKFLPVQSDHFNNPAITPHHPFFHPSCIVSIRIYNATSSPTLKRGSLLWPQLRAGDSGLIPGWEDPLEKGKATIPVFWPRGYSLYSPQGRKELDTTEPLSLSLSLSCLVTGIFLLFFKR